MKKIFKMLILIVILAGVAYLISVVLPGSVAKEGSGATRQALDEISGYKYTQIYSNSAYGFTFKYPEDFTVTPVSIDGNDVILVQNIPKKVGLQILISPFKGDDIDISAEVIRDSLPDMKIEDPQTIPVASAGMKKSPVNGLNFTSDNDSFGGNSREIWFVRDGYLYQISTYAELGMFLKELFATWTFK